MPPDGLKFPACCSVCDVPVFEVRSTCPAGHPYEGKPDKVDAPLENAWRVDVYLSNGSPSTLTVCEACLPDVEQHFDLIWRKMLRSYDAEVNQRGAMQGGIDLPNRKFHHIEVQRLDLANLAQEFILAIINRERWVDYVERERRR